MAKRKKKNDDVAKYKDSVKMTQAQIDALEARKRKLQAAQDEAAAKEKADALKPKPKKSAPKSKGLLGLGVLGL